MNHSRSGFAWLKLLIPLAILSVLLFLIGALFPFQAMYRLLVGWALFINRNVRELTVSPSGMLTFGFLAVSVAVCMVWVGRSFFGGQLRIRSALAITICIVALFAAGLGASGVAHQIGWLIRSPQPLLDNSFTILELARTSNNQKYIANGFHNYHGAYRSERPIAKLTLRGEDGTLLHGWQTPLLPFLEQQALYEKIDLSKPWNSPRNDAPMAVVVPGYLRRSPRRFVLPETNGSYALSHVAVNALLLGDPSVGSFRELTDGLTHTVLFGSAKGKFLPWGHPQNWRDGTFGPNENEAGFGSEFEGGCHMAMADGRVVFIKDSIDRKVWRALFTPRGGEKIDKRSY